ncbi:XtmB Phage terminase large subunit [uncultured Caudovirales phage]|jgi:phage terminase large subunit|uniref:XtmB Phage terminase large subunit n=1 Tax=uncultured Caudovirales phage TaxID=2100421 RepID=A0A6J5N2S8_9CAUD|nr:XtmB Phage terminase large subunit [uncultured Caudovirales phage]
MDSESESEGLEIPEWAEEFIPSVSPGIEFFVPYGGRGGAKSEAIGAIDLSVGMIKPVKVICLREFQNSISESVHSLLEAKINSDKKAKAFYTVRENYIEGKNGTLFHFKGIRKNINNLRSLHGYDIAWVEEAEGVPQSSWDVFLPSMRKAGCIFQIVFNPESENSATYQGFVKNPRERSLIKKVSWRDNPWFPDNLRRQKDHAFRVDPEMAMFIWEGEFNTKSEAQVLQGKWRVEGFEVPPNPGALGWDGPYFGADWGYSQDPSAACELWIKNGSLYCRREAYKVGVELDHLPGFLMGIPGFEAHTSRGDAARPDIISLLNRNGFPRLQGAPKWPGSVQAGVQRLRAFDSIVIHPDCPNAMHEAKTWRYKQNDAGDVLTDLVSGNDHYWDAARYALQPLIKSGASGSPMQTKPRNYVSRGGSWMG